MFCPCYIVKPLIYLVPTVPQSVLIFLPYAAHSTPAMQTIALLFLAVYSVSASTLFFNQRHAFDEQVVAPEVGKPCCIPKQVEAILVVVSPGDHDHHHHHDDDDQDIELSEEVKAIVGDADRHNHLVSLTITFCGKHVLI